MIITYPLMLLWLILIPVVILLHFLRNRRITKNVPSLLLWQQMLNSNSRSLRFRRLLRNANLILQILAIMVLTAALTDPLIQRLGKTEDRNILLVIDNSASMQTRQNRTDRFSLAKDAALDVIRRMGSSQRMQILQTANEPAIVHLLSSDRQSLKRAVLDLEVMDHPGDMKTVMELAVNMTSDNDQLELIFISDGVYDQTRLNTLGSIDGELIRIGDDAENTGVTAFEIRSQINAPDKVSGLITIQNYSDQIVQRQLEIRKENPGGPSEILYADTIVLNSKGHESRLFEYHGVLGGRITASITPNDDLPLDDDAFALLRSGRKIQAALHTPGNPYLQQALSLYPNLELTLNPEESSWRYDLTILDRSFPPEDMEGPVLAISVPMIDKGFNPVKQLNAPQITDWDSAHPLLSGIPVEDFRIPRAMGIDDSDQDIVPVVLSGGSPLISVKEDHRNRIVFFSFDPTQSSISRKPTFPLLMHNVISWLLMSEMTENVETQYHAGKPVILPTAESATITPPGGDPRTLPSINGEVRYFETYKTGFYRFAYNSGETGEFAVNMLNRRESDVNWKENFSNENEDSPNHNTYNDFSPILRLLAFVAFLVLLGEAVIWIRRWSH